MQHEQDRIAERSVRGAAYFDPGPQPLVLEALRQCVPAVDRRNHAGLAGAQVGEALGISGRTGRGGVQGDPY